MADLNARIKPKKSSTASEVPLAADLEVSEIAVNTADGKLFTKHTDNSIKEIAGNGVQRAGDTMTGTLGMPVGSAAAPSIYFDADTGLYSPGADNVAFSTAGSERMMIDASGNLGIGTSNPTSKLHVIGDINITGAITTTITDDDIELNADGAGLIKVTEYNLAQQPIVTQNDIGTAANEIPLNGFLGTMAYQPAESPSMDKLIISEGVLVADLGTGSLGTLARVTDATSPSVGSTVTGGGSAPALVWYNGTNWTVIGV